MTSTIKCVTCAGTGFLVTCSTSALNLFGSRSSLCKAKPEYESATTLRLPPQPTHLLLADERAPKHADTLADHGDVKLVLLLEPRNDLLEGRVILEFKPIPQRPLRRPVLVLLGLYRFRETEERQGEIDEPIFVLLELVLSVNDLTEEPWDTLIREIAKRAG
jgi:hypothetical protein